MTPIMRHLIQNPQGIVRRGLVAQYDFQQHGDAQQLFDLSGNGNHGTLGSTAGADTNDPAWTGQGLSFGGDDYVNIPSSQILKPDKLTIMVVVKWDSAITDAMFVSKYSSPPCEYELGLSRGAQLMFRSDPGNNAVDSAYESVYRSKWNLLTGFYDGANNLEVNNTLKAKSDVYARSNARTDPVNIGRRPYSGVEVYFTGSISYQLIYNRALTKTERMQNYHALQRILAGRGVAI